MEAGDSAKMNDMSISHENNPYLDCDRTTNGSVVYLQVCVPWIFGCQIAVEESQFHGPGNL